MSRKGCVSRLGVVMCWVVSCYCNVRVPVLYSNARARITGQVENLMLLCVMDLKGGVASCQASSVKSSVSRV
jgi:hypothetical protein